MYTYINTVNCGHHIFPEIEVGASSMQDLEQYGVLKW